MQTKRATAAGLDAKEAQLILSITPKCFFFIPKISVIFEISMQIYTRI